MESKYIKEDMQLIFKMNEEIDECEVQKIRRKLDNEIERYMPKEVIFDFDKVSFMDSAGIGLVLGRYKLTNMLGGKVQVTNLSAPVRKIFEMSGMLKVIPEVQCKKVEQKRTGTFCTSAQNRTDPKLTQLTQLTPNLQEVKYE